MVTHHVTLTAKVPKDLRLNMRLPEIRSGMLAGWDTSGPHGGAGGRQSFGPDKGSIRSELGSMSNLSARTDSRGDATVTGRVPLIYAGIQNRGGVIPMRYPTGGRRAMMIPDAHTGEVRFARRAKPSTIRAKRYIEKGFDILAARMNMVVEFVYTWVTTSGRVQ